MTKLKMTFYAAVGGMLLSIAPIPAGIVQEAPVCQAVTYDEVKSKVTDIAGGAKRFWDDSAPDRAKLSKKGKKEWKKLRKKIAKKYKKAKKGGKKALKKFNKWRKQQEKEFWSRYGVKID